MKEWTPKERVLTAFARQVPDRVPINYHLQSGHRPAPEAALWPGGRRPRGAATAVGCGFSRRGSAGMLAPSCTPTCPGRQVDLLGHPSALDRARVGRLLGLLRLSSCGRLPLKMVAEWPMPSPDDYRLLRGGRDLSAVRSAIRDQRIGGVWRHHQRQRHAAEYGADVDRPGDRRPGGHAAGRPAHGDPGRGYGASECWKRPSGGVDFPLDGRGPGHADRPVPSVCRSFASRFARAMSGTASWREAYDLPMMMHCCGSSSWAFDEFVEMGITVVETLQPEADGHGAGLSEGALWGPAGFPRLHLYRRAGGRWHGGRSGGLSYGTTFWRVMMPGGGYCYAPTHMLCRTTRRRRTCWRCTRQRTPTGDTRRD
jgi:uroporphyrinogen decarboxylase